MFQALGEELGTHQLFDPHDNTMDPLLFPHFKSRELKHREIKELVLGAPGSWVPRATV